MKIPDGYIECPECGGQGEVMYSCCTGEIITNDYGLCPVCKEHLGEEPCYTCKGEKFIKEGEEITE